MFSKLQEAAAQIDSDIRTLESKLPEVMYNYTATNPDPQPILDRKAESNRKAFDELTEFVRQSQEFHALLMEVVADNEDTEQQLGLIAKELGFENCIVTSNDEDKKPSSVAKSCINTTISSPACSSVSDESDSIDMSKIRIAKEVPGQTSAMYTPLIRSKGKRKTDKQKMFPHESP